MRGGGVRHAVLRQDPARGGRSPVDVGGGLLLRRVPARARGRDLAAERKAVLPVIRGGEAAELDELRLRLVVGAAAATDAAAARAAAFPSCLAPTR